MISLLQNYNDYYNTVSMECPLVKMLTMLAHYKFERSLSQKVKPNEKNKKWIKQPRLAQWIKHLGTL